MKSFTKLSAVVVFAAAIFVHSTFATAQSASQRQFVLVTDVDDTIKVSHVVDTVSKVIRFLADPEAFAGMSELYHAMLNEAQKRGMRSNFIVLSGTPTLLESSVFDFLDTYLFPQPLEVITRPLLMDTEEYKTEAVTTIVSHPVMKDASIILIGDDTEHDVAAYENSIASLGGSPQLESQIYIRRVKGTATTTSKSIAFDSAADIAMVEFLKGRLSLTATEKIFTIIENERSFEHLFVPGEYCPGARSPRMSTYLKTSSAPESLLKHLVRVENHLRERCSSLNAFISGILE